MELKPAVTYRKQMEIMRSRNCIITDESACISALASLNYYRLSAYFLPFKMSDDTYFPGTTFERVYGIYEFDRKMRGLLLTALEEIELFSFGMLSYFYADLVRADQRNIANVDFRLDVDVLRSWLRCCTDLRNICAHGGRLYYRKFTTTPKSPSGAQPRGNRLYDMIMVVKGLYPSPSKWLTEFIPSLSALMHSYDSIIKLNHIGFPEAWEVSLSKA